MLWSVETTGSFGSLYWFGPGDELAPDPPDRLALILGTEGDGLSHRTLAEVDLTVRIPMLGGVDSLNVAAAGAVAAWALRVPAPVGDADG